MNAYIRQGQCGSDTFYPISFGFEAIFPLTAFDWLWDVGMDVFSLEKDLLVVKCSTQNEAKTLASIWNSRN